MDDQHTLDMEHEAGLRPLGQDADHCPRCRDTIELRQRQATCLHLDVDEVRMLSGLVVLRTCLDCGASL